MASISTIDLLRFHLMERHLFNRLVQDMGKDPKTAKFVIALWLWLEEIGHYDLIRNIFADNDGTIDAIFNELVLALNFMSPNTPQPMDDDDMPIHARLINETINSRFFWYYRIFASQGVVRVMENVCNVIFGENVAREIDDPAIQPVIHLYGEGSSNQGAALGEPGATYVASGAAATTRASLRSTLIPIATPFPYLRPSKKQMLRDKRTLFITLSRGYPLSKDEIINFFTSRWGPVVESLGMEVRPGGRDPLYGVMIMGSKSVIPLVLNGQTKAMFKVRNHNLWAHRFVRN